MIDPLAKEAFEPARHATRKRGLGTATTRRIAIACLDALAGAGPAHAPRALATPLPADHVRPTAMNITIQSDGQSIAATLADSPSARDFAALLPLSLTLRDYAGIERVADLPRRLTNEGAPAGVDPEPGDITYYAPWGNLAIFHGDSGYARGLIRLGRIDTPEDVRRLRNLTRVTIERRAD